MEFEREIDSVNTKNHVGNYGDINNSKANELYKRYKIWMATNQPNKEILKFKEWINWAKNKGIIKSHKADGDDDTPIREVKKEISKSGKGIALIAIGIGIVILICSLVKSAKKA